MDCLKETQIKAVAHALKVGITEEFFDRIIGDFAKKYELDQGHQDTYALGFTDGFIVCLKEFKELAKEWK